MRGIKYTKFKPKRRDIFDELLNLFQELLMYSAGDVEMTVKWLVELDNEYNITNENYEIRDFLEELVNRGFLTAQEDDGIIIPSSKMDIELRKRALKEVFGKIKKSVKGQHRSNKIGKGDEYVDELRDYSFGDNLENIAYIDTIHNAQLNHGIEDFSLGYDDLLIRDTIHQSSMASVLLIDVSHSMILYGEDRITPAKKVAMALSEYILTRFPEDTLDLVAFGDTAWAIELDELPYLEVGPYHTNTLAALELAAKILRNRKNENKQVFMITDGKPTCIWRGKHLYKNPFGLDPTIINRCFNMAVKFKKQAIPITTFMIARDPYLVQFVEQFSKLNGGKAFYSSLNNLGNFILKDYKRSRKNNNRF